MTLNRSFGPGSKEGMNPDLSQLRPRVCQVESPRAVPRPRPGHGEGQGEDGGHEEQGHVDHHPGQEEVGAEDREEDGKDVDHHGEELQEQVEEQEDLLDLPILPVVNKDYGEADEEGDEEDPACGDQLLGINFLLKIHDHQLLPLSPPLR